MAEIPLMNLKIGDRVIATQIGGNTSFTGTVSHINRYPPYRGETEVIVWLDRAGGTRRDIGLRFTAEDETHQWTFREDPAVTKEEKAAVLGLAHVARRKNLPEDVEGVIKGFLTRKTKGGRRRKTRKSRR
jgi:hypothetical protein